MHLQLKYPILLALFAIIFAAVAHAAPVAVSVSTGRVGRGKEDAPADNLTLKQHLDSISEKETKLKETDWSHVDVDAKVAAYEPIFEEIGTGMRLVAEGDTSAEAQKMRDWSHWAREMEKKLKVETEGREDRDDSPDGGNMRRYRSRRI